MDTMVILSGASGSGKTTACSLAARAALAAGFPVAGVVCGALFRDGAKIGIQCADVSAAPGSRPWPLAAAIPGRSVPRQGDPESVRGQPAFDDSDSSVLRYGMWEFNRAALAAADEAVCRGIAAALGPSGDRIVFVDEIGPLELDRGVGLTGALAALDWIAADRARPGPSARGRPRRDTFVVVARPDIAGRLAARWPGAIAVGMEGMTAQDASRKILALHREG